MHFQARPGYFPISVQDIKNHFPGRQNYQVNDYQALYLNEDTGVYFTFVYGGQKGFDAEIQSSILPAYFSLSFSRSHVFVLEAEPELSEFVSSLNLLVSDPYMKGAGYIEYNEMDFYKGWNDGNSAHYKSLIQNNPELYLPTLSASVIEKCWRWNYHLKHLQSELGQDIFVPRILFVEYRQLILTAVVWTDAIPIALPQVDSVILYRKNLAPRGFMKKREDMALVMREAVEPILTGFPFTKELMPYYTVIYKDPPQEIKSFFQQQKSVSIDELKFISPDNIHDRELVELLSSK